MANGKVDFFNDTGGYGFISTDDGDLDDDEDVFFHMEDVGGPDLEEGQRVRKWSSTSNRPPRDRARRTSSATNPHTADGASARTTGFRRSFDVIDAISVSLTLITPRRATPVRRERPAPTRSPPRSTV